ncbi:hypothetical protein ACP70R_046810 [Stipagrostis hirtigluma subsp. patula]
MPAMHVGTVSAADVVADGMLDSTRRTGCQLTSPSRGIKHFAADGIYGEGGAVMQGRHAGAGMDGTHGLLGNPPTGGLQASGASGVHSINVVAAALAVGATRVATNAMARRTKIALTSPRT